MKMHEIRELIRLVDESDIEQFELDNDGTKVMLKKASNGIKYVTTESSAEVQPEVKQLEPTPTAVVKETTPSPAEPDTEVDETDLHKIVSPMVGTFYKAPAPDADPYVNEGDQVEEKTVVCIVEAMKLMNEIEAEVRGKIVKVLVENGQLVEYGQPLFLVKTD
ncbi:acetyl-CoA carboxylase biotin carboxyl carrier protein [Melghirimyces algeriensis]|nr:acetyl-CoA carboxylase biotin carboxyl carrier protein [Melghirimyces algeriensis]